MTVLVVDDDVGARALMRRVLVRDFNANVVEADDGVTGLERLLAEPAVDLLLLDVRMRVMDGLRTLEAVRRSPRYSNLRVVMLTGMADEERVTRAMQLGVTDFMVKPLTQAALRDRLAKLLGGGQKSGGDAGFRLDLKPADRIIVLDSDAAFREFFATTLTLCQVEQADSELAALKHVQRGPLAALFLGKLPGQLDLQVFLQTFRAASQSREVPIVAVVGSRDLEETRETGIYDAVIVRSFDAGSFTRSVAHTLSEPNVARLLLASRSPCLASLTAFANKTFGDLLRQPLTSVDGEPPARVSARWLSGRLQVQCGGQSWELKLHLPFAVALEILGTLRRIKTDEVSESQAVALAGDLVTQLATHLRGEAAEAGLTMKTSAPQASILPASNGPPPFGDDAGPLTTLLDAREQPAGVWQLVPRTGATAAAMADGRRA